MGEFISFSRFFRDLSLTGVDGVVRLVACKAGDWKSTWRGVRGTSSRKREDEGLFDQKHSKLCPSIAGLRRNAPQTRRQIYNAEYYEFATFIVIRLLSTHDSRKYADSRLFTQSYANL